ncbi:MAG: leucyl aminopeptidase [Thermodesulfobacteriota bacterium]|nr:leucyl aminopeptidase [Thermodesulfobacteriota bacterium]
MQGEKKDIRPAEKAKRNSIKLNYTVYSTLVIIKNMSLKYNLLKDPKETKTIFVPCFSESLNSKSFDKSYSFVGFKISNKVSSYGFEGTFMEKLTILAAGKDNDIDIVFIGLGKRKDLDYEKVFKAFSSITYNETQKKYTDEAITIIYPDNFSKKFIETSLDGINNGHYVFDKYKSKKSNIADKTINLVLNKVGKSLFNKIIKKSLEKFQGVNLTKDLVNEQPLVLTPEALANVAKNIGKFSNITCKVYDKKEILKRKMLGLWDVGKGSSNLPRFIHLKYKSKTFSKSSKKIALIGKGVTYDSGGLSLKPADYMVTMKMDMAGAGCVLGVFEALGRLQPKNLEVHGLIPSVENMPGPNAYKPDDIVKGLSGKTIEVINTDAEGRVILSDAIEYANRLKVDQMIDLATLTGACMIALGNYTAGLFSNDNKLTEALLRSSKEAGEKLWQLPLDEELRTEIDSNIADIKNAGSTRYGGAITAAMFIQFFVKDIPWSHLDIAGPAYIERKRNWTAPGATGYGVRTLLNYLKV